MDADRTDEAIRRFEAVSMDYSDAATMYALAQIEFLADGTGETWAQAYTDSYAIYLKVDDAFYTLVKDLLYNPMEGSYLRELAETLNTELWVEQRLAGAALEELYTDIDPDAWYVVKVATAIAAGVMQGTSDTTFSPDADTTRGQLVTMLYRMDGEPELEGNLGYPFEDVAPTPGIPTRCTGPGATASSWATAARSSRRRTPSPGSSWRPCCTAMLRTRAMT